MAQTTKRALASSFKELLAQKPFNKITIGDITERCGVNRMTFYYHFHDIYDLARWAFQEERVSLLNDSLRAEDWEKGLLTVLEDLKKNRQMITNICRSIRREDLEKRIYDLAGQLMEPLWAQEGSKGAVDPEEWDFLVQFYTGAVVSALLRWVEEGMKTEPEILARRLDQLCTGGIRQAVQALRSQTREG